MGKDRYEHIPKVYKDLPRWSCYRRIRNEEKNKWDKVPYDPITGSLLRVNEPTKWSSFSLAVEAFETGIYDGIGFLFGNGTFGIDLDHVISEHGELSDDARWIVDTMDSYTEYSPSRTGLHILCIGTIPAKDRRRGAIEMYSEGRFFTVTGEVYGQPKEANERTQAAAAVHERYIKREERQRATPVKRSPTVNVGTDLIEKAKSARNGDAFTRLWAGNISDYNDDHSAADMALCNMLAFWTNSDAALMDSYFRESGLMREKWDERRGEQTYGEMTISEAIASTAGKGYDPKGYKASKAGLKAASVSEERPDVPQGKAEEPTAQEGHDELPRLPEAREVTPNSMYLNEAFSRDIEEYKQYSGRKTGFDVLDKMHGALYPGMYVLGAIPSLGKTTLLLQIADQLSAAGSNVIYFSLEQTRMELVSKSLSRITAQQANDEEDAVTAAQIKAGIRTPTVETAIETYKEKYASRICIIDGAFDITMQSITATVEQYIKDYGIHPVVIVDYLQIVQPTDTQHLTGRDRIDDTAKELKRLQNRYKLIMFVVSSFNRQNYIQPVDYESFKESGQIEYTCDVVWGLQLHAIHNKMFSAKDTTLADKREDIRKAKSAQPRYVDLVCLKNRYGESGYTCEFEYDTEHDRFMARRGANANPKRI